MKNNDDIWCVNDVDGMSDIYWDVLWQHEQNWTKIDATDNLHE